MTHADINDLETRDYIFKIGDREKAIQARYDENTDALIFSRAAFDYVYKLLKEALSQEPTEKPMTVDEMEREYEKSKALFHKIVECDDAISREDALNCLNGAWGDYSVLNEVYERISKLPSVTQKYGKWIEHPEIETSAPEYLMFYECSECGDKQCFCKSDIHKKRFCNNCGAKMESEDKE